MIKNILNNKDKKAIKIIIDEINSNYYKLFNHYNQKYKLEELLKCIIVILKLGLSYRNISLYTDINWNTIYKFNMKLIHTNLIKKLYLKYKNKYISEMNTDIKYLYTDTTFICNKNGKELTDHNPQVKKHKTTKLSLIIDNFNNPISVGIYKSTIHDSSIIKSQLDDLYEESPILFDNRSVYYQYIQFMFIIFLLNIFNKNIIIIFKNIYKLNINILVDLIYAYTINSKYLFKYF